MPASYETINYSLRPAKQIERKMICEVIKRLGEFGTVETYRYVGLGSNCFSDFSLIHRRLNVTNMLSIERDEHKQARFEFNRPYECIKIDYRDTNVVLPSIDWSHRLVMWLDFDDRLSAEMLADIGTFCANAVSGSFLIVTVNAHFNANENDRLGKLRSEVGNEMVPIDAQEKDLAGWQAARMMRRIMANAGVRGVNKRNGGRIATNKFLWKQVLNFEYADGAKMTTLGGILLEAGHLPQFERCNFKSLEFVRDGADAYRIEIPSLTHREIRYLDTHLPRNNVEMINTNGIPLGDVKKYVKVYRYFPNFAEAEL